MSKIVWVVFFLLLVQGITRAEAPATVTGTLGKPENTAKVAAVVGHSGVLFIRSEARWDEFNKLLPDLKLDTPLPKLDFSKQNVVLVYADSCRSKTELTLAKSDLAAQPPKLDFLLRWDNSLEDQKEFRYAKFILAVIPTTDTVGVTLFSHPALVYRSQPQVTEFSATLGGKDGGDIVDGLQAAITPKAATIKLGEEIVIDFELHLADPGKAKPEQFGSVPKSVFVWDAVWSEGYRNYSFLVTTPDGKTHRLQRPEQPFLKNVPHPVEITNVKPYPLHEGPAESAAKSLKELGLDTTAPGTYTITGMYEETGSTEDKKSMWGGSITTNTVTVEVKK